MNKLIVIYQIYPNSSKIDVCEQNICIWSCPSFYNSSEKYFPLQPRGECVASSRGQRHPPPAVRGAPSLPLALQQAGDHHPPATHQVSPVLGLPVQSKRIEPRIGPPNTIEKNRAPYWASQYNQKESSPVLGLPIEKN